MIPRIFHQIWVGADPLPDEFKRYQESWKRHHPGWEFRFWTENNLPHDLRRPEVYERLRVPAERSDILRLEILFRYGGVYVDTDFECRRSIEPLIDGVDFFTAYLKPGRVNNAIIGSIPEHPILDRALREVRPREYHGYDKIAAGPLFFDRLISEYPEIAIFEPHVFYPATPAERKSAVAIHHAARSWKDADGFRQATLIAEERLARAQSETELWKRRCERARNEIELLDARLAAMRGEALSARLRLRLALAPAVRLMDHGREVALRGRRLGRRALRRAVRTVRHLAWRA